MLLTKTGLRCLAGVVLAILPSATPGADAAQPSTPPTTVSSLRTALDSARASLHNEMAMNAANNLLKALALAGVDIRVKRDAAQDQTVVTMRVFQNSQLHLATCANADCFEATVGCAAEILKAFEPAQPVPVQPVPEKAPGVLQK